jgi:hypothetical protein
MEKELIIKVSRFIELSNKFSKKLSDIFPDEQQTYTIGTINSGYGCSGYLSGENNTLSINGNLLLNNKDIYVDENGQVKAKDHSPITRADNIRAKAELKAILSDEFDEYCLLQNELGNFFKALNKINK